MKPAGLPARGARPRGRPREFDVDIALDGAIVAFRERGYHATSIPDLADAMNIASGSLYKAFGDKRAVFLAALDRYASQHAERRNRLLARSATARDRLRDIVALYAEFSVGAEGRLGCLMVGGAIELASRDPEVDARVASELAAIEGLLAGLIVEGHGDGTVPHRVDPQTTARVMICLLQGMRVVGRTKLQSSSPPDAVDVAMKLVA